MAKCGRANIAHRKIAEQGHARGDPRRRRVCGFRLIFPAAKMAWLLRNGGEEKTETCCRRKLCQGTIDSWLVYKLTGDHAFKTDFFKCIGERSLFNLKTLAWDDKICEMFEIPVYALARVRFRCGVWNRRWKDCFRAGSDL